MKCKHDNYAEECEEPCSHCEHECKYHNWSNKVPCFVDECMCEGFDCDNKVANRLGLSVEDYCAQVRLADEILQEVIEEDTVDES